MKLNSVYPADGATKARKRVGRGVGSGLGKTSGRGQKGQKARSGYSRKAGFEGGQLPLFQRLPKRGFHNHFRVEYEVVNLSQLNVFEDGAVVDADALIAKGFFKEAGVSGVKVLGNGELKKKLTVKASKFSETAKKAIEAAGGSVEVI